MYLQCCLVVIWLVPLETAAVLTQVMCTPQTPVYSVNLFEATSVGCICVYLPPAFYFRQNGEDILCATAVTRGWNQYRNESLHRKLTLAKKSHPPLLRGLEPDTRYIPSFNHESGALPLRCPLILLSAV